MSKDDIFSQDEITVGIQGFPNYLVTSFGRVYNKVHNRFLKPDIVEKGYKRVVLYNAGVRCRLMLHRLVAISFIENPYNKPEVNHIDHNPSNNNLSNLEWVTRSENQNKSNARYVTRTQGQLSNLSTLTEERVDAIRCLLDNNFSEHKISRVFSISRSCIHRIRNKLTWRHYNDE